MSENTMTKSQAKRKARQEENKKAHESVTTPHCRIKCSACGANKLNGGKCDARS